MCWRALTAQLLDVARRSHRLARDRRRAERQRRRDQVDAGRAVLGVKSGSVRTPSRPHLTHTAPSPCSHWSPALADRSDRSCPARSHVQRSGYRSCSVEANCCGNFRSCCRASARPPSRPSPSSSVCSSCARLCRSANDGRPERMRARSRSCLDRQSRQPRPKRPSSTLHARPGASYSLQMCAWTAVVPRLKDAAHHHTDISGPPGAPGDQHDGNHAALRLDAGRQRRSGLDE